MDRRAFIAELEGIYRERYREFLRVAKAIVGDEPTAHDAVQDGFARAIRARRSYRGEGTLEAWVWKVVLNAARAIHRDRAPEPAAADAQDVAAPDDHRSESTGIGSGVAALPERQRLAVFLRYYADLDYRGIATALDVEVGTVSATLNAAHATLRRSLEEVRA